MYRRNVVKGLLEKPVAVAVLYMHVNIKSVDYRLHPWPTCSETGAGLVGVYVFGKSCSQHMHTVRTENIAVY